MGCKLESPDWPAKKERTLAVADCTGAAPSSDCNEKRFDVENWRRAPENVPRHAKSREHFTAPSSESYEARRPIPADWLPIRVLKRRTPGSLVLAMF